MSVRINIRSSRNALGLVLWALVLTCAGVTASAAPETAPNPPVNPPGGLTQYELNIWNSEIFQQRFAESYIANNDLEPAVTAQEREVMLEVLEHMKNDRMDDALALLEENRGDSASAVFDFTVGNLHFQREGAIEPNDPNDPASVQESQAAKDQALAAAAAAYRIAVEKHARFRRAWRNLGVIYIRTQKYDRAAPALTRVVELGGGDSVTYGLLGFAYTRLNNPISAESAFRNAILLDPETFDWKMGLAQSFFEQERFHEAAALCRMLIAEQPRRVQLWLLQANAFIRLDQPLHAAENYELIDRMGASTHQTLSTLGDIYINEELFAMAADAYMRSMELDKPGRPDRVVRAAKALTGHGAMDQAERLIQRIEVVFVDQLSDDVRKDLLRIQARMKLAEGGEGSEEAAAILERLVQLDPLDGDALIQLGQHYGRKAEAAADRAAKLAADKKEAAAGEAREDARALYAKAEHRLEQAAGVEEHEADALVRHAQLQVQQKNYTDALKLLRRAQRINPRDNVQDYLDQVERVAKSNAG